MGLWARGTGVGRGEVRQGRGWGPGARNSPGRRTEGHTGGGGSASAPVATVFPALVQLTLVACVAGLAAALGLPPRVEEAAATIEALQVTGSRPRSCRKDYQGAEPRGWGGIQGLQERGLWTRDGGPGRGMGIPSGGSVGEGTATQVPLSSRFPLGQVQTGPLGLSRQSHSHFLRSQGLVTAGEGRGGRMLRLMDPELPLPATT